MQNQYALYHIKQNDEHPERGEIKYNDISGYFYRGSRNDGLYEQWYENGQLHERCNYKNGVYDGLYERWYDNRQIKERCNYKNGNLDSLYEEWYENGQVRKVSNYNKDGIQLGLEKQWNIGINNQPQSIVHIYFLTEKSFVSIKSFNLSIFE